MKYIIFSIFFLQLLHSQNDTVRIRRSSAGDISVGVVTIAGQMAAGYGAGYLGYAIFYKAHGKISPWATGGWLVGSTLGVYFIGELAYNGGSVISTCIGGIVGTGMGFLGIPIGQEKSGYYLLLGTLLGEVIGYHLSTDKIEIADNITLSLFPQTPANNRLPNAFTLVQINF